jgi:hypothetical protein
MLMPSSYFLFRINKLQHTSYGTELSPEIERATVSSNKSRMTPWVAFARRTQATPTVSLKTRQAQITHICSVCTTKGKIETPSSFR